VFLRLLNRLNRARLFSRIFAGFFGAFLFVAGSAHAEPPIALKFPLDCKLNENCFLQQLADFDPSPGITDPFCGYASYDGHDGTDFRILSITDIPNNVAVIAAADGIVKVARDGEEDHLVETTADREAVKNRECGNGLAIDHGNGIETRYCHMKKGSLSVAPGQIVKAGDRLGSVGVSGLAQFPHLHFTLVKDGIWIDPFTGSASGEKCGANVAASWWQNKSLAAISADGVLLGSGLAGAPVDHITLMKSGLPKMASTSDTATIGWVWLANLRKGDRISMSLTGPSGFKASGTTIPLDNNKASWSGFVGKKTSPASGSYEFGVAIVRDGKPVRVSKTQFTVE
jgi:hypothetical protein